MTTQEKQQDMRSNKCPITNMPVGNDRPTSTNGLREKTLKRKYRI